MDELKFGVGEFLLTNGGPDLALTRFLAPLLFFIHNQPAINYAMQNLFIFLLGS